MNETKPCPQDVKIPHVKWASLKCTCCGHDGSISGIWVCEWGTGQVTHEMMCAACGLAGAYQKYPGGFMRRKLVEVKLMVGLTYA